MRIWKLTLCKISLLHLHLLKSREFWTGFFCACAVAFATFTNISPTIPKNSDCAIETKPRTDVGTSHGTKQEKILCWVVTTPWSTFKAERVKKTWGRKCDKLLFMSSKNDSSVPAIGLPIKEESRDQLWNKAKLTFRYIYDHYIEEYDWFFKADDDTYVVMENLRHYLSSLNSSLPLFLGRHFKDPGTNITFLAGGSGYALTRETMRRLVERGLDQNICDDTFHGSIDDIIISDCLTRLDAILADTRDEQGLQRFVPFNPENLFNSRGPNMRTLHLYDVFPTEKGYKCCSTEAVSFHYVAGYKMQLLEYLIYKLRVHNNQPKPPESELDLLA